MKIILERKCQLNFMKKLENVTLKNRKLKYILYTYTYIIHKQYHNDNAYSIEQTLKA